MMYDDRPENQHDEYKGAKSTLFTARNDEDHPLLRVFLLGPFRVEWLIPSQDPHAWESRTSARSLFKLLLCAPGRQASKAQLAGILWPESTEEKARESLRSATKVLARVLTMSTGEKLLDTSQRDTLKLPDQSHLWVDIDAFDWWITQAEQATSHQEAIGYWQQAQQLLQGDFLADDSLQKWVSYRWIKQRRQALWMSRCRTIRMLADLYIRMGAFEQAEKVLEEHVAYFPTDQDALFRLLRLLVEQGCLSEAQALYKRAKQALAATGKQIADHIRIFLERSQKLSASPVSSLHNMPLRDVGIHGTGFDADPQILLQKTVAELTDLLNVKHQDVDLAKRQFLQQMLALTGILFALPSSSAIGTSSTHTIRLEETLSLWATNIKVCWHLIRGKGLPLAEEILIGMMPMLIKFTVQPSLYQPKAARLAAEACLIRAILAKHQLNFVVREIACHEAIQYSRIAGDRTLEAAALMYLGYTYIVFPPLRPQQAVETFTKALEVLEKGSPLLKSDISMGLADAYAQCKDEQKAFQYIQVAHESFPVNPEQDVSYFYADCALDTVYQWEAKAYLSLCRHDLGQGYYRKSWNALEESVKVRPLSDRCSLETVIYQAETAQGLEDLDMYAHLLGKGANMARDLQSQLRYQDALTILHRTPSKWQKEKQIHVLTKDVFHLS